MFRRKIVKNKQKNALQIFNHWCLSPIFPSTEQTNRSISSKQKLLAYLTCCKEKWKSGCQLMENHYQKPLRSSKHKPEEEEKQPSPWIFMTRRHADAKDEIKPEANERLRVRYAHFIFLSFNFFLGKEKKLWLDATIHLLNLYGS